MPKSDKPKKKNPGAAAKNAAASYWHRMACRVYLYLENTEPNLKGDARLQRIATYLNKLGVRTRDNKKLSLDSVRAAIKTKKSKASGREFEVIKLSFADHPGDLLDFTPHREYEAATCQDIWPDGTRQPWELAETALALEHLEPMTGQERVRAYQQLVDRSILRLKAVLAEAELMWERLRQQSEAAGVTVRDFPSEEIIKAAFPNGRPK